MSTAAVANVVASAVAHGVAHDAPAALTVVDVVSDLVCPWCWVGKRNLEAAISQLPQGARVVVRWHPYQIRPDTPREGTEKPARRPGQPVVGERLRLAAEAAGVAFTGRAERTPNTLAGHTMLHYASETAGPRKQNELQEVLFRQYFTDGIQPDAEGLRAAAEEVGLDADEAVGFAEDEANQSLVAAEAQGLAGSGIRSVPLFCVNGVPIFNGLHTVDNFRAVLEMARAT